MSSSLKHLALALSCLIVLPLAAEPLRVYMIGNSLTDEVKYDAFTALAKAGGTDAVVARKMIPGAPIAWHLDHPTDGFLTKPYGAPVEAFANHTWDALTLQPFRPGEAEAAVDYARQFWTGSPKGKVYVYTQWPDRRATSDWLAAWKKFRTTQYEPVVEALRAQPEGSQTFLIPVGWALKRFHKKAQLGLVPGFSSVWDLYSDGVHVNNIASYLVGLTFYATLTGKSPVGLPVGDYQGKAGEADDHFTITPELAALLQETAWEAVTGHHDSGVTSPNAPALTLPALSPAVSGEPYEMELDAAFGRPPYRFKITTGKLPAGLVLSDDGVLSGVTDSKAPVTFIVGVIDSKGRMGIRNYALPVGPDLTPKMLVPAMPAMAQGRYFNGQLRAASGNPPYRWTVTEGALPAGLFLREDGRLSGSPAFPGSYKFTLTVRDNDAGTPESDSKPFTGTIAAGNPAKVLVVRKAKGDLTVDGILSPEEGWNLTRELKSVYEGQPNNRVRWDAQWQKDRLHLAVQVTDAVVITKDGYGIRHASMDSMVLYFDALNNREATYNVDDRRLAYGPSLEGGPDDRSWNIGGGETARVKTTRTPDGYIMEFAVEARRVGLPPNTPNGGWDLAGVVMGFDLENRDIDAEGGPQARIGWVGKPKNADDPSGFGTVVFEP
ncbi:MAG: putative Ig domain-containing protein [Opitutaceae bacterium]|nr:putative Ig domain-containing protein [Opitutaceae bacterium]